MLSLRQTERKITDTMQQNITRVCNHIINNLNDDFTLDKLSQIAACSKFHFHRLFVAQTGLSTGQYILMLRLKRACYRLAFEPNQTVLDIALEAGFESGEAFARAFKRYLNQTPTGFRKMPDWPLWHQVFKLNLIQMDVQTMQVDIINFPTTKIAYLSHIGDSKNILETAGQFINWRKTTGLSPVKTSHTFGIPHSDPNITPAEDFRFDVAGSVKCPVPDNDFLVQNGEIPGGRCAQALHKGSHETISDTVYFMYKNWLPQSNEQLRDFPCYFEYLNLIHEVEEADLLTKIYLPLL